MISKMSKWLLGYDEEFWSIVKDEHKRIDHLNQLYRNRAIFAWVLLFFIIGMVALMFTGEDVEGLLLFSVFQVFIYFGLESRIRIIRLYELLSAADKKL